MSDLTPKALGDLTELTTAADANEFVVDDGSAALKRMTRANLLDGVGGGATWGDPLAETTLASDASTIDFTGLSTAVKAFRIEFAVQLDTSTAYGIRLNADSGTNYPTTRAGLDSDSGTWSIANSSGNSLLALSRNNPQADTLIEGTIHVMKAATGDPGVITGWTRAVFDDTGTDVSQLVLISAGWDNAADLVDQITFVLGSGNYRAGSHVQVFGRTEP